MPAHAAVWRGCEVAVSCALALTTASSLHDAPRCTQAGLHTKKTGSRKMKKERKNRLKKLRGKALAEGQKKNT